MDGRGSHSPARAFQPYDLTWLEEPIIPDSIAGHVRVMAAGGVPIAAGESLRSLWEFKNYIEAGAGPIPSPTSPIAAASLPL